MSKQAQTQAKSSDNKKIGIYVFLDPLGKGANMTNSLCKFY